MKALRKVCRLPFNSSTNGSFKGYLREPQSTLCSKMWGIPVESFLQKNMSHHQYLLIILPSSSLNKSKSWNPNANHLQQYNLTQFCEYICARKSNTLELIVNLLQILKNVILWPTEEKADEILATVRKPTGKV